ncbi:hypothetical protein PHYSODRAFT_258689 [Phytophthora sojae]|uniref:Uncharacterized protein n=1 Tax=Phytophthora sojae (strain P6497) TaxID=1094619 RepID=G4Z1S3_PHYSP|nr:hypothetical protein PHYSODRAFT_258689 [Phytophthora sojae]EGZ26441.1 hypothetical protein PHYSODRAFT_258689 [Phytophthora sojae]|eukprot:XP_009521729.1 hypothetical protein PHYSODRAFT_258689 [Phytophthora sojae]
MPRAPARTSCRKIPELLWVFTAAKTDVILDDREVKTDHTQQRAQGCGCELPQLIPSLATTRRNWSSGWSSCADRPTSLMLRGWQRVTCPVALELVTTNVVAGKLSLLFQCSSLLEKPVYYGGSAVTFVLIVSFTAMLYTGFSCCWLFGCTAPACPRLGSSA